MRAGTPQGAERAEDGAALFEGEADGAVDDEEADREGEEAEGGEVEVEAVGEAGEVGAGSRAGVPRGWGRCSASGGRERGWSGRRMRRVRRPSRPRRRLRGADVGEGEAGGEAGALDDRREVAGR